MTWKNDNKNASDVRIISNTGLDSMTTAAITTAAMSTFTGTGTGIGTYTIDLKVNVQPAINLRRLLKLKHNQQSNDFNNPKSRD